MPEKPALKKLITQLTIAVINSDEREVNRLLCSRELDGQIRQYGGDLFLNCHNSQIAELLIDNGADPKKKNSEGNTPLALTRSLEVAQTLVDYGADVNAVCNGEKTVLNRAASQNDAVKVLFLMHKRATKWNPCKDGERFFKQLYANFILFSGTLRTCFETKLTFLSS
jgi:ankyrin repeat protein